jgi:DNA primase
MDRDLQDLKEDIRARSDIVEVVSQYTRLKRSGKNWTGLCPFHADKKPSFSVSPLTQSYRCWSCGEKGDVFTFIQKKENLDFVEALEFLARRAGMPFERRKGSPEKASEREQMRELNQLATRFFQDRLAKSRDAQAYLAQRGILKETQEKFDIGFAPDDWEALVFHLQQKRANLDLAAKIGLVKVRTQEGRGYYDTFRNRLMFPIHNINGEVIAFGGRAMRSDEQAKYLNSEQSPLFDKSRTLYGLHFARRKLSGDTPAVFVEGYVDVITAHQAGFTQCVATLGTSMTEEHARMLARYNPRVLICYDGDAAGTKATLRGAAVWEAVGVEGAEVRVARLPAGDDPDSLLRRGETAAFQAALDNAVPRIDFQIELVLREHDLKTDAGRDDALAEIIPILASVRALSVRTRYAQQAAYLHPFHYQRGGAQAIEQILADAETYARLSQDGKAPRDRNYPLTEDANRQRLAEQAPPPTYRPPNPQQWGQWPHTRQIVRRDEGGRGKSGYGNRDRRPFEYGPVGDPTPPPLAPPPLTGAEKAERQLLRALFSPEWRVFILNKLHPDVLVTPQGRRLFALIARTPASEDGGIDPLPLLRQAEAEDASEGDMSPVSPDYAQAGNSSAKMSEFIQEVLEESAYIVSNELLNETAVSACIRRLLQDREERARRELTALLQRDDLTPEQRRAYAEQYQQKMRETRGSPPAEDGE